MSQTNETPPGQTAGLGNTSLLGGFDCSETSPKLSPKQLKNRIGRRAQPRIYWVRRSRDSDHAALACGAVTTSHCLTLSRIDGAVRIVAEPRVGPLAPWRNTDDWCSRRWRHIEAQRRAYLAEHPPGDPWGDALRCMAECGR